MELTVVQGDITVQDVDAIVNAASRRMRGGGGVDGAIHAAAGPALLQECVERFPGGLPTGEAGWTHGHDLAARWVIHVVGPNYTAGQRDRSLLASCYANALRLAEDLAVRSIAFPLVSAGVYGWPREDAIRVAVDTIREHGGALEEVRVVAFGGTTYRQIQAFVS